MNKKDSNNLGFCCLFIAVAQVSSECMESITLISIDPRSTIYTVAGVEGLEMLLSELLVLEFGGRLVDHSYSVIQNIGLP